LNEDTDAHFLKGEIHYSRQEWGLALNCFRKVLQLDPSQIAAQTYVELILNILGFFHTDQFNP
jgi:tetratricopeptide (TPR) repeat protein